MSGEVRSVSSKEDKYTIVREIFGNDAEKVLNKFGTLAYDFMYETMERNPYNFQHFGREGTPESLMEKAKRHVISSINNPNYLLPYLHDRNNRSFENGAYDAELKTAQREYREFKAAEDARAAAATQNQEPKKEIKEEKPSLTNEEKISYIRTIYGDKAETILSHYGPVGYDIHQKMYLTFPSKATDMDKRAFECGMLSADRATELMGYQMENLIKFSVNGYNAIKSMDQQVSQMQKQMQNENNLKETLKAQTSISYGTKELPEVTVIAPKNSMDVAGELPKADITKLEIKSTIKSPAEEKYEKLIAKKMKKNKKKNKNKPDDVMGRRDDEVAVTLGDMKKLGIDVSRDLQGLLRGMGKDGERLIPATGFTDENTVISKELAVALINYSDTKKMMMKKGYSR